MRVFFYFKTLRGDRKRPQGGYGAMEGKTMARDRSWHVRRGGDKISFTRSSGEGSGGAEEVLQRKKGARDGRRNWRRSGGKQR